MGEALLGGRWLPSRGTSRAALSARPNGSQGFFDSPAFPRLGSCASDVEDAYAEIKKAIDEIGTQTAI